MENLDTGKEKIRQICEILKNETLQPAKEEADKILKVAQAQARQIIHEAEQKAEELHKIAKQTIAKEREVFEQSLSQACKQAMEALRQDIEGKLFNEGLSNFLEKPTKDPQLGAKFLTVLIKAVEKEGTSADFTGVIGKEIPVDQLNAELSATILKKLKDHPIEVGNFIGGVQLRLHDKNMTLDLSDEALKELISRYVRKDFRRLFFQK